MDLSTAFANINWLSVAAAGFSSFVVGGIWYGPLFGQAWMAEFDLSEEGLEQRNMTLVFSASLALAVLAATILELFIGSDADLLFGICAGFLAGLGWVTTFLGILYLFEMKSMRAFLINAGYCVTSLTLMGMILGAW